MNAPLPTERTVHRAILGMVKVCFPTAICHHSPNGAHLAGSGTARFKQVGALLGDGMRKGWPDIEVLWAAGKIAFFEVKRPKLGKVSDEQKALHAQLEGMGHKVAVVRSVDEAYMKLREWGAPWAGIDPRINPVKDEYHP